MDKKKIIKISSLVGIVGILAAISIAYYMYNMPHRDIQAADTDYKVSVEDLVAEYLASPERANEKYLDAEGESKILEVSGVVESISEDYNKNRVLLIQAKSAPVGVSCTFSAATNQQTKNLSLGNRITVKGVIRSGAVYDADLEMYEPVIMEKCALVPSR